MPDKPEIAQIPRETSDSELRSALATANVPTLLVVLSQLTGHESLLGLDERPSRGTIDGTHHMSESTQENIRQATFSALRNIRDGKTQMPDPPDNARLLQLASVLVGESVAEEYAPMLRQDMGFSANRPATAQSVPGELAQYHAVVIGCGVSGICIAIHLDEIGVPYTIFEKNSTVGGTWLENTYPGCGVDSPNHFYSFSFEPYNAWPDFYSKREELQNYLEHVANKYDVRRHVVFNTEVTSARYCTDDYCWLIQTRDHNGRVTEHRANALISAVGQLNRPLIPDIPGRADFTGNQFHSARWDHTQSFDEARVAVVGTGASAMQIVPEIASQTRRLTIFQRTRHWIRFLEDYHRTVSDGKKWLLSYVPYYRNWYRFKLFWVYGDGIWESVHRDPAWAYSDRSMNAENERHRRHFVDNLTEALNGNPQLIEKVIPSYPPFAKRMLIDNHWCETLQKDNVELVTGPVKAITPGGIIDSNGNEHPVEVIIYATGFDASHFLVPMDIRGRSGRSLTSLWDDDARAYMGMTLPDFPNFFMLYGPNTNLAHGGSIIFHAECQSRYITACIRHMVEQGVKEIEVDEKIYASYNRRLEEKHEQLVWSHPDVDSWYKNSRGRVVSVSPWRLVDYFHMTRQPQMSEFNLVR